MFIVELIGSWEGRIGRLTYIFASIALAIAYGLVAVLLMALLPTALGTALAVLLLLPCIYFQFILSLKRAHDLGHGGSWMALLYGLSFLAGLVLLLPVVGILIALPMCIFNLWQCIKLLFFAGEPGGNAFGPPPRFAQTMLGDDVADQHIVTARAPSRIPVPMLPTAAPRSAIPKAPTAAPRGLRPAQLGSRAPGGFGRRGLA
jgi:uncharacterized membrane protein YhaH (DUF805 family)